MIFHLSPAEGLVGGDKPIGPFQPPVQASSRRGGEWLQGRAKFSASRRVPKL
jgi:hypothetical protein